MNLALIIGVLVVIGASIGFALLRGLPKTRIRGIKHVACFLLAFITTLLIKGSASIAASLSSTVETAVENAAESSEVIKALLADGSALNFVTALLAPLLFLIFFICFEIVVGIAYIIVTAVLHDKLKKSECEAPLKGLRALLWAVLSGILILVVVVSPLSAYSGYVKVASESIPEDSSYSETVDEVAAVAADIENSVVVKIHRALFGWLDNALATFKVGEEKTSVKTELPVLAASFSDLSTILESDDMADPANAEVIRRVADRMENAPLLASLLGSVVYQVSDEYVKDLSNADDPITYTTMVILHKDATDPAKLRADLYSLADTLTVYGAVGGGSSDAAALDKLLKLLAANPNMEPLLEELKRLAREAVQEEVSFTKDENGEYSETVQAAVNELNELSSLSKAEQKEKVLDSVKDLLDEADISATDARVDYFVDVVVNELIPEQGGEITPESAESFLVDYITEHYAELVEKGLI